MNDLRPPSRSATRRDVPDASAARLRAVADAVQDAIVCVDARGVVTLWLGGAEKLLGWSAEEALGQPMDGFFPARLRSAYLLAFRDALAGERDEFLRGHVIDIVGRRRDGSEFPAELTVSRGEVDGEPFLVSVIRDMGAHHQAEVELALARTRFRSAFEYAATGMTMTAPDGRFITVNEAFCQLVGRSAEELQGLSFSDITHPADQEGDLLNVARLASGAADHIDVDKRYLRPNGEAVWVEAHVTLVRDEHGAPLHYLTQVVDVTERRRTARELERSNAELAQFAAVAAHDLSEPLRIVDGFLRLLEGRAGESLDEDGRRFIAEALGGAQRMRDLIDALLGYARVGGSSLHVEPVDLGRVAREAEGALAAAIWDRGTRVELGDLPTVEGDPALLRQVLQNLLANAVRHARADEPRVTVRARAQDGNWEISIADNGPGVPEDIRPRAFDLFARGKNGGTGLGLAICRRAIERHGGRIWIAATAEGGGADMRFTLPDRSLTPETAPTGSR